MRIKEIIELLQEVLTFHDDVEKAYSLPDPSLVLQEKYGKEGAYYIFTHLDIYGEKIIIFQLADWNGGNHNYWIEILINGILKLKKIEFVKGLLQILQDYQD